MPMIREVQPKKLFMGKLDYGSDLLEELTSICKKKNIYSGKIEAIGAVTKAVLAYYNQEKKTYETFPIDKPLEIIALIGNISSKDNKPIVHAHITLADKEGKTFGGHLVSGTILYACEFIIQQFDGYVFKRGFDEVTGLPLWKE